MMKAKDLSVATSMLLQGYLRANDGDNVCGQPGEAITLAQAIQTMLSELVDWAENLESLVGQQVRDKKTGVVCPVVKVQNDGMILLQGAPITKECSDGWRNAFEIAALPGRPLGDLLGENDRPRPLEEIMAEAEEKAAGRM